MRKETEKKYQGRRNESRRQRKRRNGNVIQCNPIERNENAIYP